MATPGPTNTTRPAGKRPNKRPLGVLSAQARSAQGRGRTFRFRPPETSSRAGPRGRLRDCAGHLYDYSACARHCSGRSAGGRSLRPGRARSGLTAEFHRPHHWRKHGSCRLCVFCRQRPGGLTARQRRSLVQNACRVSCDVGRFHARTDHCRCSHCVRCAPPATAWLAVVLVLLAMAGFCLVSQIGLAIPISVNEDGATHALVRSFELARGHRGYTALLIIVTMILATMIGG